MSNLSVIPYTEIVERILDQSRSNPDTRSRMRGLANEVYTSEISSKFDWPCLKHSSAILCTAQHNSGYASVTTQDTVVHLQSSPAISAAYTGRKIKFNGNGDVYDVTYTNESTLSISPALSGITNVSTTSYTIYQPIYSLPSDFDRFPKNGGLLFYQGGQPKPVPELVDDDYYAQATASPTSTPENCRILGFDVDGNQRVEIIPPPSVAYVIVNEYIRKLSPLYENTAGTITLTANSTSVTGTSTEFTMARTGDYVRADGFGKGADSTWYRIKNIVHNSSLELVSVFRANSGYVGSYTISAAPQMPFRFHEAIIYGAVEKTNADQQDPVYILAHSKYAEIMTNNIIIDQTRHMKDSVELIAEDSNYRW